MASEYNCTQFTNPYPEPDTVEAKEFAVPMTIISIVKAYRPYHYYILVSLVAFSFFSNIMIVTVLCRKEMRSFGVNVTMLLIAICDFGCSTAGVIQLFLTNYIEMNSYAVIVYIRVIVDYLTVAFHGSSLFLAVGMAFCRVMSSQKANTNRNQWQSPKCAICVSLVLCPPVFVLATSVLFMNSIHESEDKGVFLSASDLAVANGCFYLKAVLWNSGITLKLVPCLFMLIFSLTLLKQMNAGKHSSSRSGNDKHEQIERSSRFIQFVLILFLVTETPLGIFNVVAGLFVTDYMNYYQQLVIFMNVVAFLNTSTSFIVYSILSSKFRKLFSKMFLPNILLEMCLKPVTVAVRPHSHFSRTV